MTRKILCLLLLTLPAAADWKLVHDQFKKEYKAAERPEQRAMAWSELARSELPKAAEFLMNSWSRLEAGALKSRTLRWGRRQEAEDLAAKIRRVRETSPRNKGLSGMQAQLRKLRAEEEKYARASEASEADQGAILDALRTMKSPEVIGYLADVGLKKAKSPLLLQATAVQVANHAGTKALLKALSRTKKPAQTVPLLQGIGRRGHDSRGDDSPEEALGVVIDYLTDRDDAVRVAAAQALARFSHPKGVEPLIRALSGEQEGGRVFRMFVRQLQILTGQKIGPYPEPWQRWWRENKETVLAGGLTLGAGKPISSGTGKGGRFYGIPQRELRIIYVLDISGSMDVDMFNPKWVKGRSVPADFREESRLGHAIRELLRAVKKLRKGTTYTVVFYADHASVLWNELRPANDKNYNELKRELDTVDSAGSTNTYESIDLALRVAGVHPDMPRVSQKADAIYLVSDGAPTNSSGKPEHEGERTLAAARQWNALRRVVIHTIGIGREHSKDFMAVLASQNDGDYYAVEPKRKRKSPGG